MTPPVVAARDPIIGPEATPEPTSFVLTPAQVEAIARRETTVRVPGWEATPLGREITAYVDWMRARRRAERSVHGALSVLVPLAWYYASRSLTDLSGKQGHRLLVQFLNEQFQNVKDSTLSTYIAHLKAFFKWAYDEELIDRDPTARLERPKRKEREYELFTAEQQEALERLQPDLRDRVAVMLIFDLALRANDIRNLRFADIDDGMVRLGEGKGGTARVLPIRRESTRLAVEKLILVRKPDPNEYLLHPKDYRKVRTGSGLDAGGNYDKSNYRWRKRRLPESRLKPMSSTRLNAWWRQCLANAGIAWQPYHHRMHDARHTTGTRLYRDTGNIRATQKFMRHRDITATELYVHLNEAEYLRDTFAE